MAAPTTRFLIINPNSTQSMTNALKPIVDTLAFPNTEYTYFTGPSSSPSSINDEAEVHISTAACLPELIKLIENQKTAFDGYLVACYSKHSLVSALTDVLNGSVPVIGIFEASIATALLLLNPSRTKRETFGIVSTGTAWEFLLTEAVLGMLGTVSSTKFAGVETTGLHAVQLHTAPEAEVEQKVREAAGRLREKGNVRVVVLGCAGMVGMEEWVRSGMGEGVRIVDGVKAGVGGLIGLVRGKY